MTPRPVLAVLAGFTLTCAGIAAATTVWDNPKSLSSNYRAAHSGSDGGTEAAPSDPLFPDGGFHLDAGDTTTVAIVQPGIETAGLSSLTVTLYATTAANFTAGTLQCWVRNPLTGLWYHAKDSDLEVAAGETKYAWLISAAKLPVGRIAFVPSGVGQPTSIYIIGDKL